MRLHRFCLAFAVLLGLGSFSHATPVTTAEPLAADSLALIDYAKKGHKHGWKGGRGHKHGWRGRGRHYGWHHGRRRGWHRAGPRRHYGWHRGRHYGWRRGHRYGWRRAPRVYFRF